MGLFLGTGASALGADTLEVPFSHLQSVDGLTDDSVFSILQDRQGFLWFGTADGLQRFDGTSFVTYHADPRDPDTLSEGDISELYEDSAGSLWIGTWGEGLDRLDPRTGEIEHFRHDPEAPTSLSGTRIMALMEDHAGHLWVGMRAEGLNRLDRLRGGDGRFVRFSHDPADPTSLRNNLVWSFAEDSAHRLWVATEGGLSRFDPVTEAFTHCQDGVESSLEGLGEGAQGPCQNRVRLVMADSSGKIWAATQTALYAVDPESMRSRRVVDAVDFFAPNAMVEDHQGRLWIGTRRNGLFRFDPKLGDLGHYVHRPGDPTSLQHDEIDALLEDRSGNLWIGTRGGGVDRLRLVPPKFGRLPAQADAAVAAAGESVTAILEDRDGVVWQGLEGGLLRFDPRDSSVRRFRHDPEDPQSLSPGRVQAILEDREGTLWFGTDTGLDRLELSQRDRGRFRHDRNRLDDPSSLGDGSVLSIHEDRDGVVWVGTGHAVLNRRDPERRQWTQFRHDPDRPESLGNAPIVALEEDGEGGLWIGTAGEGLDYLEGGVGAFRHFRHDPTDPASLSNDRVYSILRGRSGVLWVGTGGGLNRLDPDAQGFSLLTVRDGLPSNNIHSILEDADGRLWLSTNRGVARYGPATGAIRNYGSDDGLPGLQWNPGVGHRGSEGSLFFGGLKGAVAFDPRHMLDNTRIPPVVLTGLEVGGAPVDPGEALWALQELALSHRDTLVTFRFAALDFTAPEDNRYAYLLEGLNATWIDLGTDREVTFSRLDPGHYTLRVRGSNNDQVWNTEGLALRISVTPPMWQTWWFRATGGTLALLLVLGIFRFRTRVIQRRNRSLEEVVARRTMELEAANEELQRFTYLVSHDLRSPVLSIQGFVAEAKARFDFLREGVAPRPELSEDLQGEIREVLARDVPEALDFIDTSAVRMDRICEAILQVARLGGHPLQLETVDLEALVRDILSSLAPIAEKRGATIQLRHLPKMLGDRFLLERIFENLLSNALNYLDPDRPGEIEVRGDRRQGVTVIRIRDNGRGIADEDIPRIFELFRRVGRSGTPGEGLGLAYVQAMLRQHRGRIECTSRLGQGTTFTITLPDQEAPDPVGAG